jgi:hypothetical protein
MAAAVRCARPNPNRPDGCERPYSRLTSPVLSIDHPQIALIESWFFEVSGLSAGKRFLDAPCVFALAGSG